MVKVVNILCLILLSVTTNVFANVSATVDRNPVIAGESFILEVVADENVDNNAFNNNALLSNFIVGRTSVSSQTSMVNFKTSYSTRWKTVLIARKAGSYIIPSFTVKGQKTAPIQLKVLAQNSNNMQQQDLFIEADVSNKKVYVQQQFTLKVKLYFASELKRGSLTEPSLEGATITQVGKDKEKMEIINGRRYRVIERNYAINPQQSGDFILSSPMFSGEVIKASARRSSFMSFGQSTPVSALGKEIAITVRPIPKNYQGAWLPSELLAIEEKWQPENRQFKVGEPITRTITLTAAGLSEEQLPKLNLVMPKGLKVYPDQAVLHTSVNKNKLVSQKIKNFAIVASKAGTYVLPKMIIPWWNTITNKYQEAILPKQTITVAENEDFVQITNAANNINGRANDGSNINKLHNKATDEQIIIEKSPFLQWLFLGLWLATSLVWFISSRSKKNKKINNKNSIHQNKNHANEYSTLIKYCKNNRGKMVVDCIIPWVNSLTISEKTVVTLNEAIKLINQDDFTDAINHLQQCYYGNSDKTWQGETLLSIVKRINQQYKKASSTAEKTTNRKLNLNP